LAPLLEERLLLGGRGVPGQNLSVALLNYPLCPEVTLADIADSTRRAFATLYADVLTREERARIVVTGHSAGGYLAALHLATDWTAYGLPEDPIIASVPISGVFALAPLTHTSMNSDIRLDLAAAADLSLFGKPWRSQARLTFVVGADESAEFQRQSADMASSWADLDPALALIAGTHHFDVIEGLAEPGSQLNGIVAGYIGAG
jgi:arylformamidase